MPLGINIRPEVEERLVARACSTGQSLESFVQSILEREAAVCTRPAEKNGLGLTPQEGEKRLSTLASRRAYWVLRYS